MAPCRPLVGPPDRPRARLAGGLVRGAVSIASWRAFLVRPLVGWLSSQPSLRTALLVVVAAGAVIAQAGGRLRSAGD